MNTHLELLKNTKFGNAVPHRLIIISLLCLLTLLSSHTFADETPGPRTIEFAGMTWSIKDSGLDTVGPGPNRFSSSENTVWVDEAGRLHLRIEERNGIWYSAEIISELEIGYGQFIFVVDGPVHEIDPNAVFGFFTWDDNTTESDSNSEMDIEVTRWGQNRPGYPNLWFSVHPTLGPGSEDNRFRERFYGELFSVTGDHTIHSITWEPHKIFWESYQGTEMRRDQLIAAFSYNSNSVNSKPRRSDYSRPLLVPKPGKTTNIRINLWLDRACPKRG